MKNEQFRNLINLFEDRDDTSVYTETDDEITIELTSHKSAEFTRAAKNYLECKQALEDAKAAFDAANDELHAMTSALQGPFDDLKTCYFELKSTIKLSLAKKTSTKTVDWKKLFALLFDQLTPELKAKANEFEQACTKTNDKAPALRVKGPKLDEAVGDIFAKIAQYFRGFRNKFTSNLKQVQSKLQSM
jgi:phage shock protein A